MKPYYPYVIACCLFAGAIAVWSESKVGAGFMIFLGVLVAANELLSRTK